MFDEKTAFRAETENLKKRKSPRRSRLSMRTKLFIGFIIFAAVMIGMIWLLQTAFMEDLYKNVRLRETSRCADVLSESDASDYRKVSEELGEKYNICISVYRISRVSEEGIQKVRVHENQNCFIHNIATDKFLDHLYAGASQNERYFERVSLDPDRIKSGGASGKDALDESGDAGESIILAQLICDGDMEYMLLFNTEIYPLSSTVSTMRLLLAYVSVLLVGIAAVMSLVISKMMARPAVQMSREASRLAMGNYDVTFDGGGYREMSHLADTLNHAAHELSGLDKMQKDLIANVSHDLRTPLTLISGYSEVMRDFPDEMTPENMQIIIDETERLSSLVSDMLDMSRLMSGTQKLNLTTFSLTETVRETVARYAKLREREGYVINFEYNYEVFVTADRVRILQVIYNLVNNAINYTGEDKKVVLRQTVADGYCRIEVIDSGEGIPESELPMIWERYYKSSSFHKRAHLGTGLGLSIVKNILALHKAKFGVRSRVGKGSCFWFELEVTGVSEKPSTDGKND